MTAELRRVNQFPKPMHEAETNCSACPFFNQSNGCTEQCTDQARTAGKAYPKEWFLFDPLLYTTWRLTR